MSSEEFCKMVTAFYGEEVSDIKQIELMSFNGEELKEFAIKSTDVSILNKT